MGRMPVTGVGCVEDLSFFSSGDDEEMAFAMAQPRSSSICRLKLY